MEALNWFKSLPTPGKIAVAVGGGGVLLFVWQPWKKKKAATSGALPGGYSSSGYGTATPSYASGIPSASTPTTPATPAPVIIPSQPAPLPGLTNTDIIGVLDSWKTGFVSDWNTTHPAPAPGLTNADIVGILKGWHPMEASPNIANGNGTSTPIAPASTPAPTGQSLVQSINEGLRNAPSNDPSLLSALHSKKQVAVDQAGLTLTPDGHVLDPKTGQYALGWDQPGKETAAAMSIHQINEYVATNVNNLTQDQVDTLHSQKVAAAAQLGYTVSATGAVSDSSGNQVPGLGFQPTPQSDYHTAPTQTVNAPTLYDAQPTSAPASKVDAIASPAQTYQPVVITGAQQDVILANQTEDQRARIRALFGG